MARKKRLIYVSGCDDSTAITMHLTDKEYELVVQIATRVTRTADYGCQPIIETATDGEEHHGWRQAEENQGVN